MNECCVFCRSSSQGGNAEQLDELSVVGFAEEPDINTIFETSGMSLSFFGTVLAISEEQCTRVFTTFKQTSGCPVVEIRP